MSIIKVAVDRPVTVSMFTLAVLLFGMVSLSRLGINLLPELSYPSLTIRTEYPGAAPGEVEQLVSKPVEEAIGVVKGVRAVTSSSKAERSDVVLEFEWGTDMDMAGLEVREKLDITNLPLDVDKPLILRFDPTLDPVMRFGLGLTIDDSIGVGSSHNLKAMRTYAEQHIKRSLESVSGVASVRVGGGLENEVQVLVDQEKASQLNISISEITQRLQAENVNIAGGRVEDGSQEYLVRTLNQFQSLDEMKNVFIAQRENTSIRLGDIADIRNGFKDRNSITRFSGFEGIEIALYKEGDANTVKVAERVQNRLENITKNVPENYQINTVYDQSQFIDGAIKEVQSAAVVGGVLAMVVLFVFLQNIKSTAIIAVSIPVSVIATFNLMYGNDITLNIMSLGGIALAVGLLVDNSIVVLENIDRQKQAGEPTKRAALTGTQQVSTAIVASTLTTIAVFVPLIFVEGIAGQLFRDQALTVAFALVASLVVALTLIPMLAARGSDSHKENAPAGTADLQSDSDSLSSPPTQSTSKPVTKTWYGKAWYYSALPFSFISKVLFYYLPLTLASNVVFVVRVLRKTFRFITAPVLRVFDLVYRASEVSYKVLLQQAMRARIFVVMAVLLVSAFSVTFVSRLGTELIPALAQGEFFVEVTLPSGSPITATDAVIKELSAFTRELEGVERTYALAGTGNVISAAPGEAGENWGTLHVVMAPSASAQMAESVRQNMRIFLSEKAGVESEFGQPELFNLDAPMVVEISGYELASLKRYGDQLVELMRADTMFSDVNTTLKAGDPELTIAFDHARLAQLNLQASDVSELIAAKIGGRLASTFSVDERKIDITVRGLEEQRDSISDIEQLIVNPGMSPSIPLNAVASIGRVIGPSEITRTGQQRVVLITANMAGASLDDAVARAEALISELRMPATLQARVTGQSEDMKASFASLQFALCLAIFLVYLVMASQFESLLHPFLILFTVPLAGAGSIYGLCITGTSLSVVVFIGLIMLAGIVVNNAIVLVDRINQLRREGMEKRAAIIDAAHTRFRPIMMTTATTILGLLPMAIGLGDGSEIRAPMAIAVIFGLLYASCLTLVFIPVIYDLFDRKTFTVTDAVVEPNSHAFISTEELPHHG